MKNTLKNLQNMLGNKPTKLELLNTLYSILEKNNFPDRIEISLKKHYSSSLKKQIINLLGYTTESKKIGDVFWIRKV